jgi:hypothetical protein
VADSAPVLVTTSRLEFVAADERSIQEQLPIDSVMNGLVLSAVNGRVRFGARQPVDSLEFE